MKKNIKWLICAVVLILLVIVGYIKYVNSYALTEVLESSYHDYDLKVYMVGKPVMPYGPTNCKANIYENNKKINSYDFVLYNDGATVSKDDFSIEWFEKYVRIKVSASEMASEEATFDFYYIVD